MRSIATLQAPSKWLHLVGVVDILDLPLRSICIRIWNGFQRSDGVVIPMAVFFSQLLGSNFFASLDQKTVSVC